MLNVRRARFLALFGRVSAAGLVVALLPWLAAVALACGACGSSDGNNAGAYPGSDAGVPADGAGSDAAGIDSSISGEGGSDSGSADGATDGGPPATVPVNFLALHASPNLDEFRVCFAQSIGGADAGIVDLAPVPSDPTQPIPDTNIPGVAIGRAAQLPSFDVRPGTQVTPIVVRVNSIFTDTRHCPDLFCQGLHCVQQGSGYFVLPSQTVFNAGAYVLSVEGCVPLSVATPAGRGSVAECGASFDPVTGNLSARFVPLDSSSAAPWSVRVATFSASLDASAPDDAGGLALRYVNPVADASIALPLDGPPLGLPSSLPLDDAGVIAAYFALSAGGTDVLRESLLAVQHFESPGSNPYTFFTASGSYLVAVMGDATDAAAPMTLPDGAPAPSFDGHGLHVVTYPIEAAREGSPIVGTTP